MSVYATLLHFDRFQGNEDLYFGVDRSVIDDEVLRFCVSDIEGDSEVELSREQVQSLYDVLGGWL